MAGDKNRKGVTLLAAGTFFEGKLTASHEIQIYGEFSGEIETSDVVIIGRDGVVKANILAKSVILGGTLVGDLSCTALVTLEEGSKLQGNVTAKELVIKRGSLFHGQSTMIQDRRTEK